MARKIGPQGLLPCPFCGMTTSLDATCRETERVSGREFYYVFCEVCEASGPTDYVQANAIERWNERKSED